MKKGLNLSIAFLITALLCACGNETSEETGWNVYTYSEQGDGSVVTSNDYSVSGEQELADLLKGAEAQMQLPSYIPAGYEFAEGNFSYYVTQENLDQAEVSKETGEGGNPTNVYTLKDDVLKQADGFLVTYSDGEGKEITVEASYVQSMDLDTGNTGFAEAETQNYELGRSGASNNGYLGEFFREAQPIYGYDGSGSEIERKVIFVRIWMSDGDQEEVVKIAESM